ncbi:MAG: hypothetical protein KC656_09320, partial [Myxococcales bacterium]|nr:hypothetical protein [Myxococcales bacterium]
SYAIMAGQGPLGAAAFLGSIALFVAAAWVMRITPAEHHEVVLSPNRVVVDETVFDAGSLSLILTDEKIVFRDRDHQAEIWHSIQRLDERMRLRTLLEGAIDRARNRHGEGGEEVPEDLRRRPEVHA